MLQLALLIAWRGSSNRSVPEDGKIAVITTGEISGRETIEARVWHKPPEVVQ
jgi:hypothetical protein